MVTLPEQLPRSATLDFYTQPATMTAAGRHAGVLDDLPAHVDELAKILQGLVIHEHLAQAYGVTLSDERRSTVHERSAEQLLGHIVADDERPFSEPRRAEARLAGNCRHFTVLLVAMLRAKGVPSRARCGFGAYFGTQAFEDHWVAEYWNDAEQRWIMVDAQIDDVQRGFLPIDFNTTDVPRDRFIIAGDAWAKCRAGDADPSLFGFSMLDQAGYWWIAGNLMRDAAALNNMEMLPWDVWGVMPGPDEPIDDERLALFDHLAALTLSPDAGFGELRSIDDDERLRVPGPVYNAIRNVEETV